MPWTKTVPFISDDVYDNFTRLQTERDLEDMPDPTHSDEFIIEVARIYLFLKSVVEKILQDFFIGLWCKAHLAEGSVDAPLHTVTHETTITLTLNRYAPLHTK